jgi:TolB-like protein/tetratricopeptide (TPR) repeat protein
LIDLLLAWEWSLRKRVIVKEHRTSIAVMPFRNLSAEPDAEIYANGFVEDVCTDLSRFGSLRVISTQSTFALNRADLSEDALVHEWGIDYLLQGSLRQGQHKIRVGVQLINVSGRETVWAERYDVPLEKLFEVQDEITATVAGRLAVKVDEVALDEARSRSTESLSAYTCWLRGMDCLKRSTLEGDEESRPNFESALQQDPDYARAYAGLSLSHFNEWTCQAWHLWDDNERNAFSYAYQAIRLNDHDPMAHSVLARVHRFRHEHDEADHHAERALALNPNDAHVLIQASIVKLFGGDPSEGYELAKKAIAINPLHGPWYHGIVGWNLFMMGQYDQADTDMAKAGSSIVNFLAYRSACSAIKGNQNRASDLYEEFLNEYRYKIAFGREPEESEALTWAVQVEPFRDLKDSHIMPDALCSAGLSDIDVGHAIRSRKSTMVRPAGIVLPQGNIFKHQNGLWTIAYEGTGAQLIELKGFHDIQRLLAQPGEPLHCLELSGVPVISESADEVIDAQSRQMYRKRIEELQADIEQAESDNDPARVEPAREELDAVIEELSLATGLGGRSRTMSDTAEKARSAVTWRIRSAIKKIRAAHPQLGQHFSNSIQTGNFCVYSPETATPWEL